MPEGAAAPAMDAADTTTTPEPETSSPTPEATDAPLGAAGEKALAEFKERARTAERELKKTQQELSKFQQASMSEQEKAVAEAEARGRELAMQENGILLVEAAVRVACADRTVDVDALLEGIDPARFLDAAYKPDNDAIQKWVDRVAPKPAEEPTPQGPLGAGIDFGQGQGAANTPGIGDDLALENMLRDAVGLPKR